MFAALVPGLRDLRSPLTAGCLLLVSAYVLLSGPSGSVADESRTSESVRELSSLLGTSGWLVVAGVLAYLVGSVFMNGRDRLERWVAAKLGPRVTAPSYLERKQTRAERVFAPFSRPSIRRLGIIDGETHDQKVALALCIDIIFGGGKRLLVSSAPLYDEYDRLVSESAFRDAAAIPGLLTLCVLAMELHYSWALTIGGVAFGVLFAATLFIHARQLNREARSMYAHAVCDGVVSTSTLDHGQERSGRRQWQLIARADDEPTTSLVADRIPPEKGSTPTS